MCVIALSLSHVYPPPLDLIRWVIDILALRVGGEKNDDEADTVGCCSLRVEHIKLKQEGQGELDIELEFLGKDSMQYKQTTDFSAYGDIGRLVKAYYSSFFRSALKWALIDKQRPENDMPLSLRSTNAAPFIHVLTLPLFFFNRCTTISRGS